MTKYSEDEYRFAAAKICAMSCALPTEAETDSLCDCASLKVLTDRLPELGVAPAEAAGIRDTEWILCAFLAEKYAAIREFLPNPELCSLMQARFDCHNVKTAIKCARAGLDAAPFFIPDGTVPTETVAAMAASHVYTGLPQILADAAARADEAIFSGASARSVDTLMDGACFAYMTELSRGMRCAPVSRLLALKADLTNAVTRLRIQKIRTPGLAAAIASDSYVGGGTLLPEVFEACADADAVLAAVCALLPAKRAAFLAAGAAGASTDRIAALLDSVFYSAGTDAGKESLLGISPVIDYIFRLEYAVKNIRIIAGGIASGYTPDRIREELRAYV